MTVEHCGSAIVTDWYCNECGENFSTTSYVDFLEDVDEPICPNCGE